MARIRGWRKIKGGWSAKRRVEHIFITTIELERRKFYEITVVRDLGFTSQQVIERTAPFLTRRKANEWAKSYMRRHPRG